MKIILDTNEYIFGLDNKFGEISSIKLLDIIKIMIEDVKDFKLLVPEIIIKEVHKIEDGRCFNSGIC
ncbi:hypothetical protein HY745_01565 [Candidatus Desantisbacteria bacterium]|nr:hypothetical protein [Candidatus Desantisbacteria bacterium]